MLVLSRRIGEKIRVGKDVWITVVDIDRGKVRIGIDAPTDTDIYREELLSPEERREHRAKDWRDAGE